MPVFSRLLPAPLQPTPYTVYETVPQLVKHLNPIEEIDARFLFEISLFAADRFTFTSGQTLVANTVYLALTYCEYLTVKEDNKRMNGLIRQLNNDTTAQNFLALIENQALRKKGSLYALRGTFAATKQSSSKKRNCQEAGLTDPSLQTKRIRRVSNDDLVYGRVHANTRFSPLDVEVVCIRMFVLVEQHSAVKTDSEPITEEASTAGQLVIPAPSAAAIVPSTSSSFSPTARPVLNRPMRPLPARAASSSASSSSAALAQLQQPPMQLALVSASTDAIEIVDLTNEQSSLALHPSANAIQLQQRLVSAASFAHQQPEVRKLDSAALREAFLEGQRSGLEVRGWLTKDTAHAVAMYGTVGVAAIIVGGLGADVVSRMVANGDLHVVHALGQSLAGGATGMLSQIGLKDMAKIALVSGQSGRIFTFAKGAAGSVASLVASVSGAV